MDTQKSNKPKRKTMTTRQQGCHRLSYSDRPSKSIETAKKSLLLNHLERLKLEQDLRLQNAGIDDLYLFELDLSDARPAYNIGAVLKLIKSLNCDLFTLSLIEKMAPELKHTTIRSVVLRLIDSDMVEVVNKGTKGRGSETVFRLK